MVKMDELNEANRHLPLSSLQIKMKNQQSLNLLFTANGISGFAQGISMLAISIFRMA
jgi:hypothetical protein